MNPHNSGITAEVEAFLIVNDPSNYGKVSGYIHWYWCDKANGMFGVCTLFSSKPHSHSDISGHIEPKFLKIYRGLSILLCICKALNLPLSLRHT